MKQSPRHMSWAALSAAVTMNAKCTYCGTREDLVAHHKVPRRMGGLDVLENLEPVCRTCHPRIERDSVAEAEQAWERPDWEAPRRRRNRPARLPRPY